MPHDPRMAFGQRLVLPDGDVVAADGHVPDVADYAAAEFYDPAANQCARDRRPGYGPGPSGPAPTGGNR